MRVESPIESSASGRKNSLSATLSEVVGLFCRAEVKPFERLRTGSEQAKSVDLAGISARNGFSNAIFGIKKT